MLRALRAIMLIRESGVGMLGLCIIAFWIFIAIFAKLEVFGHTIVELSPYPPNANLMPFVGPGTDYIVAPERVPAGFDAEGNCTPITSGDDVGKLDCGTFWLGTDQIGRDILSRILHGSRQVLIFAPLATLCAYLVGIPMGLAAGYRGGTLDDVLSFIANVILSFPVLVLYVVIIAIIGPSAVNIVLAVAFASAPGIMRIVRGLTLDLRTRE